MIKLERSKGVLFTFCLLAISSFGSAQQTITLSDVLQATIEHQQKQNRLEYEANEYSEDKLSWLDGSPTLSLAYLNNQTELGSKEAEIRLTMPIKSRLTKDLENKLEKNAKLRQSLASFYQAYYYSGLIRNLIWEYKVEQVKQNINARKQEVLQDLLSQYREMAERGAIPQYVFLLVQKEANDSQILDMQLTRNSQNLLSQYAKITGLSIVPDNVREELSTDISSRLVSHPDIALLDTAWTAYSQAIKGQSKSAQPWHLQVIAKRVDSPDFTENQIGLGVDVPLSIGGQLSATQRNEFQQAKLDYEIERNKTLINLMSTTDSLLAEHRFLVEKQTLLESGTATLETLETIIKELIEAKAPNQETHIRNLIDLIDSQGQIELNQLAIYRQIALIRQAAGTSL